MATTKVSAFNIPENQRLWKIVTAAKFAGVPIEVDQEFEMGKTNETPFYMRNAHPMGRTPTLQTEEGFLFESNAILRYLARQDKSSAHFYGKSDFQAAQCDAWMDFATTEIDRWSVELLYSFKFNKPKEADYEQAVAKLPEALVALDKTLENRIYLVGERMTVADICMAFSLQWVFRMGEEHAAAWSKKYVNVWRHYNTVWNNPKTVEVVKANDIPFGLVA